MSVTNVSFASTDRRFSDRFRIQVGNLLVGGIFDGLALSDDLREIFARALEHWLERRDSLSGAELARRLKTSRSSVSRWLNGEGGTDLATLQQVAAQLQIPAWYLLHPKSSSLPDPINDQKVAPDEAQEALRMIATKLGFRARLDLIKKN